MYELGAVVDYQEERYDAEPTVTVDDRAMRRWSSMWRDIARFNERIYMQLRQDGGKRLPAESEEFDGLPLQYEGEIRRVIRLAKKHDLGVLRDLGDAFCMSQRVLWLKTKVARLQSERLKMKQRRQALRKAVINVRTVLEHGKHGAHSWVYKVKSGL